MESILNLIGKMMQSASEKPSLKQESKSELDPLAAYKDALLNYFPSREAILAEARAQNRRAKKLQALAATTLTLAVALGIWQANPVLESQQIATAIGQHRTWNMADGSSITLNTNAIVKAEYRLHSREIQLIQGEATFNVAHGWREFSVQANQTLVRDIGTVFNVRNTADGAEVSVIEGLVEVSAGSKIERLSQNQRIKISKASMSLPERVDNNIVTAWQHGKIIFDGMPLNQVANELQRYRQAPIQVLDQDAGKLRISGIYDIQGIEALIDVLPASTGLKVRRQADGRVTLSSR